VIGDLTLSNASRIVFLIMDGVGDIPNPDHAYMTPLEAARKPNMDQLAVERSVLGRIIPVDVGITPGSGPGHLSLFGYDPLKVEIGRGILEVLGLNMDIEENDVAARGNFCTMKDDIVIDRRAGRIATAETVRLCGKIRDAIPAVDGVNVIIEPGKSHRFAILFRGEGLEGELEDADPHKDNKAYVYVRAKTDAAARTAGVLNSFIRKVAELLKDEPVANGILLRGFSKKPDIQPFPEKYKMDALAIATYPMYRGIAKVLGMKAGKEPKSYREMIQIMKEQWNNYHFFFLHVKETDVAGEDGNFDEKVKAIEHVDTIIPDLLSANPQVLVITGDHSTPCPLKGHSWHPVPMLLMTSTGERDSLPFHEKNCLRGSIGTIYSRELMSLALAHAAKLDKYGA
jgi:2,3-bisphosphoglycerate-independent phosphoglycerate mutase